MNFSKGQLVYDKDEWRNERWGVVRGETPRGHISVKWLAYKFYRTGEVLFYKKPQISAIQNPKRLTKIDSLPKPSAEELGKKYGIKHSTDCRHAEVELTSGHLIAEPLKYSDPGTPHHEYTFKSWPTQTDDILLVLLWLKDRIEEMFPTAQMDNAEWRALGRIYDAIENLATDKDPQQEREGEG